MPNRILKESICSSPTVDVLTSDEEVLFYRLIVQCDDYGLMEAHPTLIRARCFPRRIDRIGNDDVARWLEGLCKAGLAECYTVRGRPYLHLVSWTKHQQVRTLRARYPLPHEADGICTQLIADARNGARNPIQSGSNPDPDPIMSEPSAPTPNLQASPSDKPQRRQRQPQVFSTESDAFKQAVHLRDHVLGNNPAAKVPGNSQEALYGWSAAMDLVLRVDKRAVEDVEAVVDWCQQDRFWHTNILCPESVRKQFDRLWLQMRAAQAPNPNGQAKRQTGGVTSAQVADLERVLGGG